MIRPTLIPISNENIFSFIKQEALKERVITFEYRKNHKKGKFERCHKKTDEHKPISIVSRIQKGSRINLELLNEITCLLGKVAITKQRIALTPKPSKISKKMIPDYCIGNTYCIFLPNFQKTHFLSNF